MNTARKPPQGVPVLTDVLELSAGTPVGQPASDDAQVAAARLLEPLVERIARELDRTIEARMRAALEPELARLAERALQAARDEIALGLRQAIERVLAEHDARRPRR